MAFDENTFNMRLERAPKTGEDKHRMGASAFRIRRNLQGEYVPVNCGGSADVIEANKFKPVGKMDNDFEGQDIYVADIWGVVTDFESVKTFCVKYMAEQGPVEQRTPRSALA